MLGGHTLRRHVGKIDSELLDVVKRDRYVGLMITVARKRQGSFLTRDDATNFVSRVLDENQSALAAVASGHKVEAEFTKRFGLVTGKEAFRPDPNAEPYIRSTYGVYVHVQRDARARKGYRVFRAFPINQPFPTN